MTTTPDTLRVFSFGGGVQSVACLVLATQGRIDFDRFLFANVGEDSEDPATITYFRQHAAPFAAAHGITIEELHRTRRNGSTETLYGRLTREGSRSIGIPVRMANGAPGRRSCTGDFKIKVVGKRLKQLGASASNPALVGVGISVDEIQRANTRRSEPYEQMTYPLLDLGLRRTDCHRIIHAAGLPVPPKSACYFCPFRRPEAWREMRRTTPDLFAKSCQLETLLNERRTMLGKDPVYLTRYGKPLDQAIPDGWDTLPFDEWDETGLCDSGRCFT
ncbi:MULTISPECIES: phosphoadenosine phosphosulfate reductase [Streptomyces]|uniref:phosphoadenosine phosphosulfate reductase n=1 Tax=Streptomyces TaxID=1883 RepID=UPI001CEF7593|nr:phosphoadenosine phosphosulfate reductase [Streptomyces griseus]